MASLRDQDRGALKRRTVGLLVLLVLLVGLGSVGVVAKYPVYFRADDAVYLAWASQHPNPLQAFVELVPHDGMYRPLLLMTWWFLFRAFGLHASGYQLFTTLLYALSFLILLGFVRELSSLRAGLLTLGCYLALFYPLTHIVFWFSDLTFVLELFFVNLSLYLAARAAEARGRWVWSGLAYLAGGFSKEPAILIIPAVFAVFLWTEWPRLPDKSRSAARAFAIVLWGVTVGWVALHPSLGRRFGSTSLAEGHEWFPFILERWGFYARHVFDGLGFLGLALALYSVVAVTLTRKRSDLNRLAVPLLVACAAAALGLARFPRAAFAILLLSFVAPLLGRRTEAVGGVWFALPAVLLLGIRFKVRTYLVESSMGLAVFMGVVLEGALRTVEGTAVRSLGRRIRLLGALALAVLLVVGGVLSAPKVARRLEALEALSSARRNFADAVEYIGDHLSTAGARIVVIDYSDMGLDHERDILPLGELEKARRQSTMDSRYLRQFLDVMTGGRTEVYNLASCPPGDSATATYLLVLNRFQRRFAEERGLLGEEVFGVERGGDGAWLFRWKGAPTSGTPSPLGEGTKGP